MARVKIISNPYEKCICFQSWDDKYGCWRDINAEYNSESELRKGNIASSFFPYKVNTIVDIIYKEYHTQNTTLEIVFEGAEDEFIELEKVCNDKEFNNSISVSKSDKVLENARDILPEIRDIYERVANLAAISELDQPDILDNLAKLSDAVSDTIPICIVGNYSAGKSSFINALIGCEVLPNGSNPVTAKVFKIYKSTYLDRSFIRFDYGSIPVTVAFRENNCKVDAGILKNGFIDQLNQIAGDTAYSNMVDRITHILKFINNNKEEIENISDLIELEVPFKAGLLANSNKKYIIYDTPGSNSASNEKHLEVLKTAMEQQSNGLLIFVCLEHSLDTIDNQKLYDMICQIQSIDSRFSMIVVNQADNASLSPSGFNDDKYEIDEVLAYDVPRKLYSSGIYYASSVMALGAKSNGEFNDRHYREIYKGKQDNYSNPQNEYYKQLYKYNIMPRQLKKTAVIKSEKCNDLVYANSGFYCIEDDIESFASRYSYYNKCTQANQFLKDVIRDSSEILIAQRAETDAEEKTWIDKRDKSKEELIEKLEKEGERFRTQMLQRYPEEMRYHRLAVKSVLDDKDLKSKQADLTEIQKSEDGYSVHLDAVQVSKDRIVGRVKRFLKRNADTTEEASEFEDISAGTTTVDSIKNLMDARDKAQEALNDINKKVSERITGDIKNLFDQKAKEGYTYISQKSREYFQKKVQESRTNMIHVVSGDSMLDDEERENLEKVIVTFKDLEYTSNSDSIFKTDFFAKHSIFLDLIRQSDNTLDLKKLRKTYNREMENIIQEIYEVIRSEHEKSFEEWYQELIGLLKANIISYNSLLKEQQVVIDAKHERINILSRRLNELSSYSDRIETMITWQQA